MSLFDFFFNKQKPPVVSNTRNEDNVKKNSEADLLESIKNFRKQQQAVRETFLQEHDKKLAPTHDKIERAEKFMKTSGLNKSFLNVIRHTWHWESWSKKESFGKYSAFKVSNIEGEKEGLYERYVSFAYNDHKFKFEFKEEKIPESSWQYADMSLIYDDEKVLQIKCESDLDRDYDDWDYRSVYHLVIGDWVRYIVEMDELIKLHKVKSNREFGESSFLEQAENLPD